MAIFEDERITWDLPEAWVGEHGAIDMPEGWHKISRIGREFMNANLEVYMGPNGEYVLMWDYGGSDSIESCTLPANPGLLHALLADLLPVIRNVQLINDRADIERVLTDQYNKGWSELAAEGMLESAGHDREDIARMAEIAWDNSCKDHVRSIAWEMLRTKASKEDFLAEGEKEGMYGLDVWDWESLWDQAVANYAGQRDG